MSDIYSDSSDEDDDDRDNNSESPFVRGYERGDDSDSSRYHDDDDDDDDDMARRGNRFAAFDNSDSDEDEYYGSSDDGDFGDDSDRDLDLDSYNGYSDHDDDEEDDDDDEVLSYYDSDGSDDDDDDYRRRRYVAPAMREFMANMMRSRLAEERDDDEGSGCDCPNCQCARFGLGFCMGNNEDSSYDESNYVGQILTGNRQLETSPARRRRLGQRQRQRQRRAANNNNNNNASTGSLQCSPCAICLEDEGPNRRFAYLPCCGSTGTEQTSSLQFCVKCVMKNTVKSGEHVPSDKPQDELNFVSECPRCKCLLCLTASKNQQANGRSRFEHVVKPANVRQAMWYVAEQDNPFYLKALLNVAYGLHHDVTIPFISSRPSDPGKILRNLCQWGLISKYPRGRMNRNRTEPMYWIDAKSQAELREGLIDHLRISYGVDFMMVKSKAADLERNANMHCDTASKYAILRGWYELKQWHVRKAYLLGNRALSLVLIGCAFPWIGCWHKEYAWAYWHVITAFNASLLYFVSRAAVQFIWVAMCLVKAIILSQAISAIIKQDSNKWIRRGQNASLLASLIFGLYYLVRGFVGLGFWLDLY